MRYGCTGNFFGRVTCFHPWLVRRSKKKSLRIPDGSQECGNLMKLFIFYPSLGSSHTYGDCRAVPGSQRQERTSHRDPAAAGSQRQTSDVSSPQVSSGLPAAGRVSTSFHPWVLDAPSAGAHYCSSRPYDYSLYLKRV